MVFEWSGPSPTCPLWVERSHSGRTPSPGCGVTGWRQAPCSQQKSPTSGERQGWSPQRAILLGGSELLFQGRCSLNSTGSAAVCAETGAALQFSDKVPAGMSCSSPAWQSFLPAQEINTEAKAGTLALPPSPALPTTPRRCPWHTQPLTHRHTLPGTALLLIFVFSWTPDSHCLAMFCTPSKPLPCSH